MYDARIRGDIARCLAGAFLAGAWSLPELAERGGAALERVPEWIAPVSVEVLAAYQRPPADRPRELARFIDRALADWPAPEDEPDPPRIRRWRISAPQMGRRPWPVPEIASVGELAEYLVLDDGELAWFADVRGLERSAGTERLRHYWYGTIARPGRPDRVIERPKRRLKEIQRRILHQILVWIPAHHAAHGFVPGRSVRSHAATHVGQPVVMRLDLEDFFASVTAGRVYGIFRTAGYPEAVAHTLAGLCTNTVPGAFLASLARPHAPAAIAAHHRLSRRLATPHLPQGAPTSPALANLSTFRLDRRLAGLAGSMEVSYTRYADDLTFSGVASLARYAKNLRAAVQAIAREEGFSINEHKSTLVTAAGRQQVCGIVTNQRLNAARTEYDQIRAILHNARTHGPGAQNRHEVPNFRAHLLGRIAWIASLNPARGERLRRQFSEISWPDGDIA